MLSKSLLVIPPKRNTDNSNGNLTIMLKYKIEKLVVMYKLILSRDRSSTRSASARRRGMEEGTFSLMICLGRVEVPSLKIVRNLTFTIRIYIVK